MNFRLKLALSMLCLLSLLFGAGGSLLISMTFRDAMERERQSAYDAYQSVLGLLQLLNTLDQQADYDDIRRALEQLPARSTSAWDTLRLYDGEQTVFAAGQVLPGATEAYPRRPGYCAIGLVLASDNRELLMVSGLLAVGEQTLCLDMGRDVSALFAQREAQLLAYQRVFLLLAALCAVFSYALAWLLTRPLSELSRASRIISGGDLSRRAHIRSGDEVGRVAKEFNAMADILEANIHELEASLERQKRFTGSFAHEVKTPMTAMIGYADLIRSETLDPEERREAANFIVAEGKRMERLSRKLLDLQLLRNQETALIPVEPSALIQGLVAEWRDAYAREGIRLFCQVERGKCYLEPDLVKTLLLNLCDNARKARTGTDARIGIGCAMLPDGCRITVRDNGRGIPPQALEHLTEAFYRVDKSRSRALGGAGLGLALCQEIVALHNGSLRFESELGSGTCATVELRGGLR